jgi:hypothetical protein
MTALSNPPTGKGNVMTRNLYALGGIAIAATVLLTACGGSSNHGGLLGGAGGAGAGANNTDLPAAASSALAQLSKAAAGGGANDALGGALSSLDVSKLCAAVKSADIAKLFKAATPKLAVEPGECDWGAGNITVDIDLKDTSKQFYPGGAFSGNEPQLAGVGDEALWSQPIKGMTVPFVTARKGNTDCSVTPGLQVNQTSMPYTGSDPFFTIADADAQQYASEEGQICNDIFSAVG